MSTTLDTLAADCAARIPQSSRSFAEDRPALAAALEALLDAVRQSDARFAFDREGRPDAIAAVRRMLWCPPDFSISPKCGEAVEIPAELLNRFVQTLCLAA